MRYTTVYQVEFKDEILGYADYEYCTQKFFDDPKCIAGYVVNVLKPPKGTVVSMHKDMGTWIIKNVATDSVMYTLERVDEFDALTKYGGGDSHVFS
jgi:methyl coenzyme M reductase alpha subunit